MSNIQNTLNALQPYVVSIRYVEGIPVVDAVFKEGWTLIEDKQIQRVKGTDELNYYMIFSEIEGIGVDALLGYVGNVIKFNLEREKKHELLRLKVDELKDIFKKNSLAKLTRLKFIFAEEELLPDINEIDIDEEPEEEIIPEKEIETKQIEEPKNDVITNYVDDKGNPIEISEEEQEMIEEEKRAQRNLNNLNQLKKNEQTKKISQKVELPPKRKIEGTHQQDDSNECDCGPDEACQKCIDKKGL